MLKIQQQLRQQMKLTPQQVQFLKLLQLPTLALEQRIKTELELNPLLEEQAELEQVQEEPQAEASENGETEAPEVSDSYSLEDYMHDDLAGYKSPEAYSSGDDDERPEPFIPNQVPLAELLLRQFRLLDVDETDILLAEEILGNVDEKGYLQRELDLIVQDLNLSFGMEITVEKAERVLQRIQLLDPPGIAARTLQECLVAQVKAGAHPPLLRELALKILTEEFKHFEGKHYDYLMQHFRIGKETFKKVLDLIHRLNPKPGEGHFSEHENYVLPDFIISRDEKGEFQILLNDRFLPNLRIERSYQQMLSARKKTIEPGTKDFIRKKFEAAKFFIASLVQRRETLLRVMRMLLEKQRQWFEDGKTLRPMVYRDIAGEVGCDISTISRVVTSKYVQTEYGVFPLKYFFTSGITTDAGEDVSALNIKQQMAEIIKSEDPRTPYSDDQIGKVFKEQGVTLARRTIAKYREQLGVPIARMRKRLD